MLQALCFEYVSTEFVATTLTHNITQIVIAPILLDLGVDGLAECAARDQDASVDILHLLRR